MQGDASDILKRTLQTARHAVADTLFPRACAGCGVTATLDEDLWCAACAQELAEAVAMLGCPACGSRTGEYATPDGRCMRCRPRRLSFSRMVRVGPYAGTLRERVLAYKFGFQVRLDAALAQLVSDALLGRGGVAEVDAFVPIPTRTRGGIGRSYDPVAQLARLIGRRLRRPCLRVLAKRRGVRSQVGLSPTERWTNIRGALRVRRGARLAGTTLCLIDDVSTTGATLDEAAKVLRAAGAIDVWAAVVVKADPDLDVG